MKKNDIIQCIAKPEVKARVNWCVESRAGIDYTEPEVYRGGGNVIDVGEWIVIFDSPTPELTLQEKAESMSVEELRANIEKLRNMRARPLKLVKERRVEASPSDPLALALTNLTPDQLAKIKAKLGLS